MFPKCYSRRYNVLFVTTHISRDARQRNSWACLYIVEGKVVHSSMDWKKNGPLWEPHGSVLYTGHVKNLVYAEYIISWFIV